MSSFNTTAKYKYLIVGWDTIFGTDDDNAITDYTSCEDYLVIDTETGQTISDEGIMDIPELDEENDNAAI